MCPWSVLYKVVSVNILESLLINVRITDVCCLVIDSRSKNTSFGPYAGNTMPTSNIQTRRCLEGSAYNEYYKTKQNNGIYQLHSNYRHRLLCSDFNTDMMVYIKANPCPMILFPFPPSGRQGPLRVIFYLSSCDMIVSSHICKYIVKLGFPYRNLIILITSERLFCPSQSVSAWGQSMLYLRLQPDLFNSLDTECSEACMVFDLVEALYLQCLVM